MDDDVDALRAEAAERLAVHLELPPELIEAPGMGNVYWELDECKRGWARAALRVLDDAHLRESGPDADGDGTSPVRSTT